MFIAADYKPEFESFRDQLLELAQIRHVDELLERVVTHLAARPHVNLARIWLIRPGDTCSACAMQPRCPNQDLCLHLVATAGIRRSEQRPDWSRMDGEYWTDSPRGRQSRPGGSIGGSHCGQGFCGRPFIPGALPMGLPPADSGFECAADQVQGRDPRGIAVFTSIPTPDAGPVWLRIFADEIAGAIINARAFEEIERLRSQLELQNAYLQEEVREAKALGDIIGQHVSMQRLLRQIEMVAPTDATVLILGESGTGKELVARELQRRSRRHERPLIRVNCASVPRELYESEFFGHVKGAFTGAIKDRAGRFEAADGGTLLLDEVGGNPLRAPKQIPPRATGKTI